MESFSNGNLDALEYHGLYGGNPDLDAHAPKARFMWTRERNYFVEREVTAREVYIRAPRTLTSVR